MEPRLIPVASSILDAVSYDQARMRLRIRFRNGAVFDYDAVPAVVYEELMAAPSKGAYFSEYIRPDYLYRRVRPAEGSTPIPAR